MILVTLRSPPLKSASPWLIKFRIVPTINATYKERRGTPSDTHHRKTWDSCIKLFLCPRELRRGPGKIRISARAATCVAIHGKNTPGWRPVTEHVALPFSGGQTKHSGLV